MTTYLYLMSFPDGSVTSHTPETGPEFKICVAGQRGEPDAEWEVVEWIDSQNQARLRELLMEMCADPYIVGIFAGRARLILTDRKVTMNEVLI